MLKCVPGTTYPAINCGQDYLFGLPLSCTPPDSCVHRKWVSAHWWQPYQEVPPPASLSVLVSVRATVILSAYETHAQHSAKTFVPQMGQSVINRL